MNFIKENALELGLIAVAAAGFAAVAVYHNNWINERKKKKEATEDQKVVK